MTTYDSATGAKTPTPDREAVESLVGQTLLEWQWNAFLGMLGHLPTRPAPAVTPPALPSLDEPMPLKNLQDHPDFRHTCEVCGRTGSRRFVQTRTGWRCSESAKACGRRAAETAAAELAASQPIPPEPTGVPDLCTECGQFGIGKQHTCPPPGEAASEEPAPATPQPAAPKAPTSITARCQDCTRTFTLTGRSLLNAVNMHEFKTSHIVNVLEEGTGG